MSDLKTKNIICLKPQNFRQKQIILYNPLNSASLKFGWLWTPLFFQSRCLSDNKFTELFQRNPVNQNCPKKYLIKKGQDSLTEVWYRYQFLGSNVALRYSWSTTPGSFLTREWTRCSWDKQVMVPWIPQVRDLPPPHSNSPLFIQ